MVKFCPKCFSLYGHRINESTNNLQYVCGRCNFTEPVINTCIVANKLSTNIQDYPINENLIFDYTLPRTQQVKCKNVDCGSSENSKYPEIVIFQYNPTMLKTAYICTHCKNFWKN